MTEIVSRQVSTLTGTATTSGKVSPASGYGRRRVIVITSPATATYAATDTIGSGIRLPVGTRFLSGSHVSHEALGAGITMNIGIRNFDTKAVIDSDGIGAAISVAAAGVSAANNGALVAAGVESLTTVPTEVYATLMGGTPTADAQFRIEVEVVADD